MTGEGEAKSVGDRATTKLSEDGEGTAGDMPGYKPTPEDLRLWEFYRDSLQANPGTHLDISIRNDLAWQAWWRDLAVMPLR